MRKQGTSGKRVHITLTIPLEHQLSQT